MDREIGHSIPLSKAIISGYREHPCLDKANIYVCPSTVDRMMQDMIPVMTTTVPSRPSTKSCAGEERLAWSLHQIHECKRQQHHVVVGLLGLSDVHSLVLLHLPLASAVGRSYRPITGHALLPYPTRSLYSLLQTDRMLFLYC